MKSCQSQLVENVMSMSTKHSHYTLLDDSDSVSSLIVKKQTKRKIEAHCPVCTYRCPLPYYLNGHVIRPNEMNFCPLCGFNFKLYYQCNCQIGLYYQRTQENPPKFLDSCVKQYRDKYLYVSIYKKFSVYMHVQHKHIYVYIML